MIDKLKRIDPNAGPEVLNVWLKELPDMIHQTSFTMIDLERAVTNLKDELEVIKARLLLNITEETEAGKPKYSNQNVREAALTIVLSTDNDAKVIKDSLAGLEDDIKRWEAHRDYYDKQFRITKDACYYSFRNKEINDMRELSKSKVKEVLKYAPEGDEHG
jgi:hypothetical protein